MRSPPFLGLLSAIAVSLLVCGPSNAQPAFPSKPIVVVVPFAAGSSPDVMTRIIAEALAKDSPQPVVIENRVGAGATWRLNR